MLTSLKINPVAKAVAGVASIVIDVRIFGYCFLLAWSDSIHLQRVFDIPASHRKMAGLARQLVEQLKISTAAKATFGSQPAQEALNKFIDLIVRTAREIQQGASKSSIISMCSN